jgi:tellurite resistance protein TerC
MAVETDAGPLLWGGFIVIVMVLLYIDLFVASKESKKSKHSPLRQAVVWSIAYVVMSLVFCACLAMNFGLTVAQEYLAGYLIEKSLSVDNMFVMLLTFKMFRIGKEQQKELLVWGIIGAIVLRAVFIMAGAWILHHFTYALYLFGGLLVVAAVKMLMAGEEEEDEPPAVALFLKKYLPWDDNVAQDGDAKSSKFFIRDHTGALKITPQLACLIVIEVGDIIFAVDSIPAIFAVTEDPFVVFTSNIFAILGLRAMFFVISLVIGQFQYLQQGLAAILGFVGTKMLIAHWIHIPTWFSLLFIIGVLVVVALAGEVGKKKKVDKGSTNFNGNGSRHSDFASMV